jgi:hypothetical protein
MDMMSALADMFADEIVMQPGTLDARGLWTSSGTAQTYPCHFEGGPKLVRNQDGQQVVSSIRAIINGVPSVQIETWRFTLPDRYAPRLLLRALTVDQYVDEAGAIALEIAFP